MSQTRPRIAVVGSLNVDFTFRVLRMPGAGETITAKGMEMHFGGKGANQAVAAARAGADVVFIGCLGSDEHGVRYQAHLEKQGIQTSLLTARDVPTGAAFITLDENGDNSIIVNLGANALLSIEHINRCAAVFREVDTVLLQLECPLAVVAHAANIAKDAGARVIINPSPFAWEAVTALRGADVWILNESEFNLLRKCGLQDGPPAHQEILKLLGCRVLVITRGARATELFTESEKFSIAPPKVTPVDTVGAGDTFAGAFAVARGESRSLEECLRFANAAGALATLQSGAQASTPHRHSIEEMLRHQPRDVPKESAPAEKDVKEF